VENKKFEWRDESETEWTVVDDEFYQPPKTHREAAECVIDMWYISDGEYNHQYKIFVRDVETKTEKPFEFSFNVVMTLQGEDEYVTTR
jgi:hypothetical protein